jgi:hypothetical protein
MKDNFITRHFDAGLESAGGFTPQEKTELKSAINDLQTALESKQKTVVETELKKHADTINESIKKLSDWQTQKDENDLKNQESLTEVLMKVKAMQESASSTVREKKSLQVAIAEALQDQDNVKSLQSVSKGHRAKIQLKGVIDLSAPMGEIESKTVGNMTTSGNLTGDGVASYNQRQAILPAQKVNARDLIPTTRSETGIYVTYKESAGEGSISRQTEGSAKSQIDFDFTEVKTVSEYIAGFTRFSKQLTKHLPFFTSTLPRLLQREFFKVENRRFWDIMATGATGSSTTSETDDVKQVMDWITSQFEADYFASYGLLRYTALNRLNKLLYTNGYYQGSGGVLSQADGSIRIMGVPIIPVTWIPSYDKFLTLDNDYVERVEVEGLSIEFFQEDSDNIQKNLITARIECMEEFNLMQPASAIIGDFGNSASS